MMHCCAWGCNNQTKKNLVVSYHGLPKDKRIASVWVKNINRTDLPKEVFLCSDHFEESCFDAHHDMKRRLLPEGMQSRMKRKLCKDAIPTLFRHNPGNTKSREFSEERTKRKEQSEVCFYHISELVRRRVIHSVEICLMPRMSILILPHIYNLSVYLFLYEGKEKFGY